MRKFILISLMLLSAASAAAQSKGSILGTLVTKPDGAEEVEGVVGAVIELTPLRDTLNQKYTTTAIRGAFQFKSLTAGEYRLTASSLGYQTTSQVVKVEAGKENKLPAWHIEEDVQTIEAVSVKTQAVRTTINGDTTVYNAGAYKVLPDADADELLAKMPGITVNGGSVEANGEAVQKILVDGREFFGNDVATALSTLPAEAIKSVEVFDKLSDEAEFSGIDDGNSYKAINIVTHNKMKTAIFGKMDAQYAFEPRSYDKTQHYGSVNGSVNFFREKSKTTVRFRANNMNGNAQSKMGMAGVNYINAWGKDDKFRLEGSYNFNANNNKHNSWTDREYFLTEEEINSGKDIYQRYMSDSYSQNISYNHNFNTRIEYRINPKHRLMLRAQLSFNDGESNSNSISDYFPINSNDYITLNNWSENFSNALNANVNGNYMMRLGAKQGRTLQFNFDANYSTNDANGQNYSEKSVNNPIQQRSTSGNNNYSLRGGITYAEPIGNNAQFTIGYNVNYRKTNAERLTNLYDFETGEYMEMISPEYSNNRNTEYLTQRVGPGFRYGSEGTSISGQLNFQHVTMNSDRIYPAVYVLPEKTFKNLTYSVMSRFKLNMQNRIMLRVNSSTNNPSVGDLQDVVNISNVNNISAGNPDLRPSYSHRANLGYTFSGIQSGTTFSVDFGGNISRNNIIQSVIMNQPGYEIYSPDGELLTTLSPTGRFSKPINYKDGSWGMNAGINYGFPLNFMGCNFNIGARGSLNQSPSILNDVVNHSRNYSLGGNIAIGSNFSQYVDFRLAYFPTYSKVTNTMSTSSNNEYMQHRAFGNVRVVFGFGLTLHANANYSQYVGLSKNSRNLNNTEFICNFGVGMKVLKRLGEVQLIANDVFNQNKGFNRAWNAEYMQNSTSSVIGRFFGIKFTYNLRRYGQTRGGKVIGENDNSRGGEFQGPPQGMPPGGPGGMRGGMQGGGPGGMGGGMRGGGGGFGGGGGGGRF